MRAPWRALAREPRAVDPPPVGRADWLLVGAFGAAAMVEGLARGDLPGQPYVTLLALALMPVLLWRRHHPLVTCLVGFGVAGLLAAIQIATHAAELGLASMTVVVILLYALVRWGSGREIMVGLTYVAAVAALGLYAAAARPEDIVGGSLFLALFVLLAAVVRSRADLWQRRRRDIRNEERLALARELHDTVAHHVSAIAVQAQAGGVVVRAHPERAAGVLATIEAEATRTLAEMRSMVRVLRQAGWDAYAPQPGAADLSELVRAAGTASVRVSLTSDVSGLPGPVDSAVYRMAQEALTNALRHARGATHVSIDLCRVGDDVRLRVSDDGPPSPGPSQPGFGVIGMAERAHLLGGTFTAGPAPQGGWVVEAVLPAGAAE